MPWMCFAKIGFVATEVRGRWLAIITSHHVDHDFIAPVRSAICLLNPRPSLDLAQEALVPQPVWRQ